MKVENMTGRNGNKIANQFIITDKKGKYFQSYSSIIAFKPVFSGCVASDRIQLDRKTWDYSRTTAKYRNIFLGETTDQIKAKIKSGEYMLVDLN